MKKLIALCAIASVATAFAADDNVFGCLRVDSSAAETIVAVPWVAAGVTAGEIKVADIVKTANLNEGDELWWYNNTATPAKYEMWQLKNGAWEPMPVVAEMGEAKEPEDSTKQALSRGDALLLIRNAPIATCFYLYGQVPTTPAGVMTMGFGTATVPCYTLIAPPSVEDTNINSATWGNVAKNDYIIVVGEDGKQYQLFYDATSNKWGVLSYDASFTKVYDYNKAKILAGQGAWFVSAKGSDKSAATVNWTPKTEE